MMQRLVLGALVPVLRLRRTPPIALALLIILVREMSALPPSRPPWPSEIPPGSTVTSWRALCYLVREGEAVGPASLLDDEAFDRRVGVAYRVGTHVRTYQAAPIFEDLGFEVTLRPRSLGDNLGDTTALAPRCMSFAEAAWAAAPPPEPDPPVADPPRRWNPRTVRQARIAVVSLLAADSMLGVGAWWQGVLRWQRRRRLLELEEERRRVGLCRECGYPLEGLPVQRCPECGREW